jgi:hypothetical protein
VDDDDNRKRAVAVGQEELAMLARVISVAVERALDAAILAAGGRYVL